MTCAHKMTDLNKNTFQCRHTPIPVVTHPKSNCEMKFLLAQPKFHFLGKGDPSKPKSKLLLQSIEFSFRSGGSFKGKIFFCTRAKVTFAGRDGQGGGFRTLLKLSEQLLLKGEGIQPRHFAFV